MKNKSKNFKIAITSMFAAIIILLSLTPIGYIPLGVIKATIIHIPVILGSVLLGPGIGAILGLVFGLTSLVINTTSPALLSFVFSPLIPVPGTANGSWLALIICFIPRILIGVVPYYVYTFVNRLLRKYRKIDWIALTAAGIAGAMTNTLLVMHLIYLLFQDAFANARGIAVDTVYNAVLTVIATNGVAEALLAGFIITALGKVLLLIK